MKTTLQPLFVLLFLICASCEIGLQNHESQLIHENGSAVKNSRRPALEPVRLLAKIENKINIRFTPGLAEVVKDTLRNHFGVVASKKCSCSDQTMEQWTFADTASFDLEELKEELDTDTQGLEGSDFEYLLTLPNANGRRIDAALQQMINKLSPDNQGVTIAIVDSGVDFGAPDAQLSSLYDSQTMGDYCTENGVTEISGWDFVNDDNIPEDNNGHGTIVAGLIVEQMISSGIPFRILPVKAFGQNGEASYFDVLCSTNFALEKEGVQLLNSSFGGQGESLEMLSELLAEFENEVLMIASAGNTGTNNDTLLHYPSSCQSENVLAVAAVNEFETGLAYFSNMGALEVDIAAVGENILFNSVSVDGTSFSCALVTAKMAEIRYNYPHMAPLDLISTLATDPYSVEEPSLMYKLKYPRTVIIQ